MEKEVTLDDVKNFIRKYGYKYAPDIRKELDKTRTITEDEIENELRKNSNFYKKMADI